MDIEATARELLSRDTLRRLARRSNYRGLSQLGLHVGLLTGTGFVVWASRGHWWLTGALVVHGMVISFLFCALHESIHGTAFASRWLNDAVARVCGALLMLPPEYFRLFHSAHHRYTQRSGTGSGADIREPVESGSSPLARFRSAVLGRSADCHDESCGHRARAGVVRAAGGDRARRARGAGSMGLLSVYPCGLHLLAANRGAALLGVPSPSGPAFSAAISIGGAYGLPVQRRYARKHADNVHQCVRAVVDMAHVLPRGAPLLSVGALSCPG